MKPFIKWVGGKSQILNKILEKFPDEIDTYHEVFLGGGSVLLGLLSSDRIKCKHIVAYDINPVLIHTYVNIKTDIDGFLKELEKLKSEYDNSSKKDEYYYSVRQKYNEEKKQDSLEKTAMFLFLNKTCFRGLYREGPNGFNVPYGNYKNPQIFSKEHMLSVSKLIQDVDFKVMSFTQSLNQEFNEKDFIYLDPPYVPETNSSFVKYFKDGFNKSTHAELFEMCRGLKCNYVMSNSETDMVIEVFKDFSISTINCKRRINSKKPESSTNELIISNY